MKLLEILNWRYATKSYNGEKVPADKLEHILEAARLAPTSSGLQPLHLIVVSSAEMKEKIKPAAMGQRQITECSDVIVFAAWDHYTPERIHAMFDLTNEVRGMKNEGWEKYRDFLLSSYTNRDPNINFEHAARQAYIALGMAIVAAAEVQVDATPMEGFDPAKLDEILGLRAQGLRSCVLLPVGYRDAKNDWAAPLKKVRRPLSQFVTRLK